jgi:hypothetical protein
MELFQMFQWVFGDVNDYVGNSTSCSITNRTFTYIAFILIWFQPILFNIIGYMAYQDFAFINMGGTGILVFIYGLFSLFYSTEKNVDFGYPADMSSIGRVTCTYIGLHNHLAWMFKGIDFDFQVNYILYSTLCWLAFKFYAKDLWGIPLSWFLTLLTTILTFNVSAFELPSFWCMLSVEANFIIILYHYIFVRRFEKNEESNVNYVI